MAKRFVIPFATSGDKSVTPDATDPGGAISYSQGWPVAYQLADTDPNYRPVGRQEMNGVLFDVTGALAELQTLGFPEWVAVSGLVTPYAINAVVRHNSANWRNTVANNSVEPGTDATWVVDSTAITLATAGAAPAFTLSPTPALPAYATYQRFRVQFNATPVGVPTLNVSTRGAVNLKQYNSTGAKVQAVIASGQITDVEHDGTDFVVLDPLPAAPFEVPLPYKYFAGFTLTNNVSAPNTTIDVGPGSARDSTNTVDINLSGTLRGILQSSGAWTAGDNQNKLDTGAKAISSDYHKFVIGHPTLADDILYSLSPTAPTMPSGYVGFRRVGHISTDSSGNIRPFKDRGDGYFDLVTPIVQIVASAATPGTSPLSLVGVGGAPALVKLQIACGGDGVSTKVIPTDVTNSANTSLPTTWTGGVLMQAGGGSAFEAASGEFEVRSDTSKQVTLRTYAATGTIDFQVLLMGWRVIR